MALTPLSEAPLRDRVANPSIPFTTEADLAQRIGGLDSASKPPAQTRAMETAPSAPAPGLAPEVHIRIGRIDIRGAAPAAAPVTRPVPPKPAAPTLNLEAYLRGLDRRSR